MDGICKPLAPGITLRAIHTNKFKSAVIGVSLLAPLDPALAAANALIPSVLCRGTERLPDMQALSAELEALYGGIIEPTVRRKGETQCIGFTASFLDDACTLDGVPILGRAAALLGELLLRPAQGPEGGFVPEYVSGERSNLIDRLRAQRNNKIQYAAQRLTAQMCQGEPYGTDRLGDEESAAAITPEGLWTRYQTLLAESEVFLFYCGSAEPAQVEAIFAAAFGGLPRAERLTPLDCKVIAQPNSDAPREFTERMDVAQGQLAMGFRTGGASVRVHYPALLVFNAVFGGSLSSKLFLHVRERLSLCYYASSAVERIKGVLIVSSGVEFSKLGQARDEILAQLRACQQGDISADELNTAREFVASDLREALDTPARLEDYWLMGAVAGMELSPEALAEQLLAVTAEQVVTVAKGITLDSVYRLIGKEV